MAENELKKTAPLSLMLYPSDMQKLKQKAKAMNLTLTAFFEKIARENIIFLDDNLKTAFSVLDVKVK